MARWDWGRFGVGCAVCSAVRLAGFVSRARFRHDGIRSRAHDVWKRLLAYDGRRIRFRLFLYGAVSADGAGVGRLERCGAGQIFARAVTLISPDTFFSQTFRVSQTLKVFDVPIVFHAPVGEDICRIDYRPFLRINPEVASR